jgi:hypothetical protein
MLKTSTQTTPIYHGSTPRECSVSTVKILDSMQRRMAKSVRIAGNGSTLINMPTIQILI